MMTSQQRRHNPVNHSTWRSHRRSMRRSNKIRSMHSNNPSTSNKLLNPFMFNNLNNPKSWSFNNQLLNQPLNMIATVI